MLSRMAEVTKGLNNCLRFYDKTERWLMLMAKKTIFDWWDRLVIIDRELRLPGQRLLQNVTASSLVPPACRMKTIFRVAKTSRTTHSMKLPLAANSWKKKRNLHPGLWKFRSSICRLSERTTLSVSPRGFTLLLIIIRFRRTKTSLTKLFQLSTTQRSIDTFESSRVWQIGVPWGESLKAFDWH